MNEEYKKTMQLAEDACDALFGLWEKGFPLPGYVERNGKPFLMKLLTDVHYDKMSAIGENYYPFWTKTFMGHEAKLRAIASPHGWAMLKILMHKAELRRKREEKAKIRNKKARARRKELARYSRLQDV